MAAELILDTIEDMSLELSAGLRSFDRNGIIIHLPTGDDVKLLFDADDPTIVAGMPVLGSLLHPTDPVMSAYILRRKFLRALSGTECEIKLRYEINSFTGGGPTSSLIIRDQGSDQSIRVQKVIGTNQGIDVGCVGVPDGSSVTVYVPPQVAEQEVDVPIRRRTFTSTVLGAVPTNPGNYNGAVNEGAYYGLPQAYWKFGNGGIERNIYEGYSVIFGEIVTKTLEDWSIWSFARNPITGGKAYRSSAIPAIAALTYKRGIINDSTAATDLNRLRGGVVRVGHYPLVNFDAVLPFFSE